MVSSCGRGFDSLQLHFWCNLEITDISGYTNSTTTVIFQITSKVGNAIWPLILTSTMTASLINDSRSFFNHEHGLQLNCGIGELYVSAQSYAAAGNSIMSA